MKAVRAHARQMSGSGGEAAAAARSRRADLAPGGPRGARSQWRRGRRRAAFEPRGRFPRRPSSAAQRTAIL